MKLFGNYVHLSISKMPSDRSDLPVVDKKDELVDQMEGSSDLISMSRLSEFRTISQDRSSQYESYDQMASDSIIAAALEIYADDATQYDEQGRVVWVESDSPEIAKAGNRLLDILEIPERAWKHIHQACLYGDYYLKLFREGELEEEDEETSSHVHSSSVKVVNDKVTKDDLNYTPQYVEYVEDVEDPATIFDLQKRGKTAGFVEVEQEIDNNHNRSLNLTRKFSVKDTKVYRPDRFIHIKVSENMSRYPETITLELGDDTSATYRVSRGKSILYDVFPIQKELQLLEDSLLLNRLTRSSLIRLLEIEVGDMPKKEVNNYLRRIKQLVEQHIAFDKDSGDYKSFQAPGPIDNVIYIPVKNGKGSVSVNNLGGDVNVRDIADIDYFNNKRAGALKIPRSYLGDDMDGSGLSNGGSLTRLSIRYARTIKRIQTSYIRAITQLLNLFFIDKKLDYVNKFTVRMTSPSTQEDLERNELIQGNIELINSIMSLTESLQGATQKKVLDHLISNVLKMPEIAAIIEEDKTPEEEVQIDGEEPSGVGPDLGPSSDFAEDSSVDASDVFSRESGDTEGGFTQDEYSSFEDELPSGGES